MLDLKVATLTVVKKADHIGRDEPMLWTMFIAFGLGPVNENPTHPQYVITTDPVAGKLGKAGKGDRVNVPAAVGHFHDDKGGILLAGVLVVAFDNDLRTEHQIRDGYAAAAAKLNQAIIDHFPKYGVDPVGKDEKREIQGKIRTAIKEAFLADSVILTVFGGKPIGGDSFTLALAEDHIDESFSLTLNAKHDWAIYRVDGRLQFDR